jgi:hypothetical protein
MCENQFLVKTSEPPPIIEAVVLVVLFNFVHLALAGFFNFNLFLLPGLRFSFQIFIFLAKPAVARRHLIFPNF